MMDEQLQHVFDMSMAKYASMKSHRGLTQELKKVW